MSRGAGRIALAVLAVLVLVGTVAVASSGSTPAGTSDGRRPSELVLDTFFSLALLMLVPGAALVVWALTQRKAIAQEIASGRYPRTSLLAFLVFMAIFSAIFYAAYQRDFVLPFGGLSDAQVGPDGRVTTPDASANDPDAYRAEFAWIPVLAVLGLAAVAIAAYVLSARRRRPLRALDVTPAEELAGVLDDTLEDLRAEPDPRRAVIAAYARLEHALGSVGIARRPFETAEEYVARVLAKLDVDRAAIRRLTDLFTVAKFSQHEVDEGMRDRAIDALAEVRDELRAGARVPSADEPPAAEQAAPS